MKIAFLTLGCKLNYAETSTYERGFKEAGLEVVPWQQKADIYLVNTCSVTATSDSKSRNLIRKVHRVNPSARIVVTGCSAQLRREEIERISGVTRVFGAEEKSLVVSETLHGGAVPGTDIPRVFGAYSTGERTRSFLKVQDGCNNFCKYCTVPYARGRSRNIPISECVENARKIASEGIKEIVLTGVNTGDFGRTTGESFLDLLKALNDVDGIERYRISSIEPNLITEEIVDWIASGTKFQPHFHIPLQTGADSQLEAMGRHYDTAFFRGRIDYIRSRMEAPGRPKVFFGIDVMVGLPGESEELFLQTKEFIESVKPAFIHVFPYSKRPGTPAASMPGQVSEEEKKSRVAVLEELCTRLHEEFVEENRGVAEKVLFESACKDGMMEGYTGNYIRVRRPYDKSLVNTIVDITL
ncbi:MAG: tRNA (N(6)-L-threonylcarbamoyladenosine(37)-C(2))-methylthiotransferase MtaB [Bacteroides sp.]|nr:tRNA (N(6)-L-threonylcarbamoyladenosine(37)-C(2))-methylthiotransferase MtaB [Bacteroides sp.]CCX54326.1 miaB-like tRNA modifying enzyme [Bacteroides sp. CAG:1060]